MIFIFLMSILPYKLESHYFLVQWAYHRLTQYSSYSLLRKHSIVPLWLTVWVLVRPYAHLGVPGGSEGKESACSAGDLGLITGLGRSPGEGNGYPLQYSCLENPMDGGAWQATVHWVTKGQIQLRDFTLYAHLSNLRTY